MTSIASPKGEHRRSHVIDALAIVGAGAFGAIALILDIEEQVPSLRAVDLLIVLAAAGALWWRHSHPVPVVATVIALRVASIAVTGSEIATAIALMFAFYALTVSAQRRWSFPAAIGTALGMTLLIVNVDSGESWPQELLAELATTLLPATYGEVVRSRSQRLNAAIEAEAQLRVQAERLRIARDLHDVVAHGLTSIAVQSGTAAYNLPNDDPDDPARIALERINEVGKRSLEELRGMVGVLRSTDTDREAGTTVDGIEAPLRPTPTNPDDFSDLIESAAMAQIDLSVELTGSFPDDTSEATIVATHRIAQEALTNVARHAGAVPATLSLSHHADHADLRIVNTSSLAQAPAHPTTGVGIIGMRERAESIGGTLVTTPLQGGGFEVIARLPYRRHEP